MRARAGGDPGWWRPSGTPASPHRPGPANEGGPGPGERGAAPRPRASGAETKAEPRAAPRQRRCPGQRRPAALRRLAAAPAGCERPRSAPRARPAPAAAPGRLRERLRERGAPLPPDGAAARGSGVKDNGIERKKSVLLETLQC